jgi:RNA polymerase sigma-70 factor, ECF subfamily
VLGGDRDAFRAIVDRESNAIVRVCYRVLGNLHDAEDAAQETFLTAYRAIGTWRGEGPFGAWLARIAVRVSLRHAGRRGKHRNLAWIEPPFSREMGPAGTGSGVALESAVAAAAPQARNGDPVDVAIRSERDERIRSALAQLREPYREIVALRFFGELSLAEISAECGRPVNTVKTHLRRGLLLLRETMETES